jgi:hypothetical protein
VTASTASWFQVDKEGLAKLMERKGKEFILYELLQNSWDTNAKKVDVSLRRSEIKGYAEIEVIDDHPEGWKELAHAWTLYAESEKKADAEKRGRFNIGEKLVLALCRTARIETTTGGVAFDVDGRHTLRTKRAAGSRFSALVRMNQDERVAVVAAFMRLIPPSGVVTTMNGATILPARTPLRTIQVTLATEVADDEGVLRRSSRKAQVEIYEPLPGETASIYEMGIPVVETGDRWHYNVGQKVPLNVDRDNVTPAYLQSLRTAVLNAMHGQISKEDAVAPWVRDASADPEVVGAAVEAVMTHRFGEKRVIADPTDPEGTKLAMSQGYTVVPGGSLSGGEWANVKRDQVMLPAGQVTPSPKPYSPDAPPMDLVPYDKYTEGMKRIVKYAQALAFRILEKGDFSSSYIQVDVVSKATWPYAATYGPGHLTFNLGRLGHAWFEAGPREEVDRLLIHEFGHHFSADHLSEEYHDAICKLGAKLTQLAIAEPEFFKLHGRGGAR